MNLSQTICFQLAKRQVLRRQPGAAGENPATFETSAYHDWRVAELRTQFTQHFAESELAGKDVLDFGCGSGTLSVLAAEAGARSVIGIDLNDDLIGQAQAFAETRKLKTPPRFVTAQDARTLDLPDASVDLLLCFDVLEHVLAYDAIIPEWRRVLRPGGEIFIWWVPWLHPYGHHLESLVPLPWAHVFFSERTLLNVCARVYDLPEFKPRWWDLDEHGRKKPNKWRQLGQLPDLNRLTIAQFERLCQRAGLQIARRELYGFGGSRLGRLTHGLTRLPWLREYFCSRVIYRLRKAAP